MASHDCKTKRNDNLLKNLPTEVLLKARSTLVSLGGALKPKQEPLRVKTKHEIKDKKDIERLKTSRSEPEFSEARKNHRSRINDVYTKDSSIRRTRPLSVGALKRYDKDGDSHRGSYHGDLERQFNSTDEVCVQSRLVIPVNNRLSNQEVPVQEVSERPRKKLSFREPEIVGSGSNTLGRSHKIMGVNSLSRRPNRNSRSGSQFKSLDNLDFDLESQAMKIVRTVGQAFEVCHKMQDGPPDEPVASTSSAVDETIVSDRGSEVPHSKEAVSDCGVSETGGASTSKAALQESLITIEEPVRPKTLELHLPPPPRKEKRSSPRPTPILNLPDLPECVTKVEVASDTAEAATPLSAQHQLQLLKERLEQQAQQTRAAVAQLLLLRDQLAAEQAARCEAQARTHQLLVHNKDLIDHIAALVAHLQEHEHDSSRPINAQQLTLLPQKKHKKERGIPILTTAEVHAPCNGNLGTDTLIDLINETNKVSQNVENNNVRMSPYCTTPTSTEPTANGLSPPPIFANMTNEEIQNYLISKFEHMGLPNENEVPNKHQQFYQNSKAFPHIPPLSNHYSSTDLSNILQMTMPDSNKYTSTDEVSNQGQAMSLGQSETSLYSSSDESTSKDSSPTSEEGGIIPFIMPLSHNGTLTATGEDGRVRVIVPVSPSPSTSAVSGAEQPPKSEPSGSNLNVSTDRNLAPPAPIARTTSEKVPNRSEMMSALRAQWTRHTTK